MPIILLLALGVSVYFIGTRIAEAAEPKCPEALLKNTITTMIEAMKAVLGERPPLTPAILAQTKEISEKCQTQLVTFLNNNPAEKVMILNLTEAIILDAKGKELARGGTFSPEGTARMLFLRRQREAVTG